MDEVHEEKLSQMLLEREREIARDKLLEPAVDEPQATQKLTSIELLRAAQMSKKPVMVNALSEEPDELRQNTMTGNTALEDVPEALLGYEAPQKTETPEPSKKEVEQAKQPVPDQPIPWSEPSDSNDEDQYAKFTPNALESGHNTTQSRLSGLNAWWILPVLTATIVGLLSLYLW